MKNKIKAILFPQSSVPATLPGATSLLYIPIHHEIADSAYALWEQEGRPEGRDTRNWLDAEQNLRSGVDLSRAEDAAFGDPDAPLDADGEPTGSIQENLRRFTQQPRNRSATSL